MAHRLQALVADEEHAMYVAQDGDGRLVSWVPELVRRVLVEDLHAEIGGIVVDEG
jgi:hypothetical protein